MSLTSLTKQAEAKFYLSSVEIGKVSQLSFALTDTTPAGPFSFDVRYQTAFPNQPSNSNWSDLAELAEMLNQGVLTDLCGPDPEAERTSCQRIRWYADTGLITW